MKRQAKPLASNVRNMFQTRTLTQATENDRRSDRPETMLHGEEKKKRERCCLEPLSRLSGPTKETSIVTVNYRLARQTGTVLIDLANLVVDRWKGDC